MLTIRTEQIQGMKESRENDHSIPRLCQHLRKHYHYTTIGQLSDEQLTQQVKQAVNTASSYGLQSERDIYGFVTLELTFFPNFHRHEKVQALLQDPDADPKMRMYWLMRHLPSSIWFEIYS